ncbi:MAG: hypothetical protein JWL92_165 [Candidatus Nomurabacteria bacterium]|nr:hypothetical protein [Candidatus Nomurabacteria bacterium]
MKGNKGFTLIELLVVIAIIGILASVILASLNSARLKARNAQRITQVRQLITAFNLSYDNGTLPVPLTNPGSFYCISSTCSNAGADPTVDAFLLRSISQKPTDPDGGTRAMTGYYYNANYLGKPIIEYTLEDNTPCQLTQTFGVNNGNNVCIVYIAP